ncbi:short chain enoyl-CoA hydratase [Halanaerobium congolense]|jgi:enoyl-CoA hydratase|uniref:Short chain enoyl-CoA hydratase n=1 Tax=Halanaerobium congolense TaxID=54121 RepID=A0A4V3E6W0_9FIRM|nr:enoyl-CoA hydratase-related protein [Halanaerobium congolense]PTX15834.1 short chain enoyl-CoA hydratase [Halanaerobium congolense]TDS33951.1 short chain enoyl-CoA hydratase [Halanaerobium congolense]TDX35465.1 short chain enoyl-CoA hydratase [Halanaerobium congolense]SDF23953.1 short chain enoyl-CoA hydratase [Halanaerobium congolense]SES79880.1 short chain enoyl-CoA hydratase [Halanaerobium congolense]
MAEDLVKCDFDSPTAIVSINRPEVLNAYNEELLDELYQTLSDVFSDDKAAAVILTAEGNRAFSVGGDIDYLEQLDSDQAKMLSRKGQGLCDLIEQSDPVVIAAVDGYALGGGMEITLACDLRLASTRSRFGQPEVKLGIIPAFGGTQRLPRLIGDAEAKELLYTGDIIDAALAYELGLINKVVTPRTLLKEAKELALEITNRSTKAVKLIKIAINKKYTEAEKTGYEYESEAFAECFKTEEHRVRIREIKKIIKEDN